MRAGYTMLAAVTLAGAAVAQTLTPAITAALADPARADQAGDDARRQAGPLIAFAGVKPGDTVIDFFPGNGYWTRIFSPLVGPEGRVLAMWPAAAAKYAEKNLPALQARGLANVTASVLPGNALTVSAPVDVVWTVQNYHDVPPGYAATFDQSVFKALKKGGTYLIVDHADAAGKGASSASTLHRIEPGYVRRQVEAAGFRFVGESKVLANPADDHTLKVFDPAIRGRTDQFVYKFRKP